MTRDPRSDPQPGDAILSLGEVLAVVVQRDGDRVLMASQPDPGDQGVVYTWCSVARDFLPGDPTCERDIVVWVARG